MKCKTLERWDKKGEIPIDKLIEHWRNCKICKKNIEQLIKLQNKRKGE